MIEMRWVEYDAKWPETNGGYETKKKLQYRTENWKAKDNGVLYPYSMNEWMDVPTVELEKK